VQKVGSEDEQRQGRVAVLQTATVKVTEVADERMVRERTRRT
jgi:hypothetical protein